MCKYLIEHMLYGWRDGQSNRRLNFFQKIFRASIICRSSIIGDFPLAIGNQASTFATELGVRPSSGAAPRFQWQRENWKASKVRILQHAGTRALSVGLQYFEACSSFRHSIEWFSRNMRCPKCGCQDDKVIDSRSSREGATIRRRRECVSCSHRFTTYEAIERGRLMVLKRDDRREECRTS